MIPCPFNKDHTQLSQCTCGWNKYATQAVNLARKRAFVEQAAIALWNGEHGSEANTIEDCVALWDAIEAEFNK